jgi:hypothetical protein
MLIRGSFNQVDAGFDRPANDQIPSMAVLPGDGLHLRSAASRRAARNSSIPPRVAVDLRPPVHAVVRASHPLTGAVTCSSVVSCLSQWTRRIGVPGGRELQS